MDATARPKILVIDDDPSVRKLIGLALADLAEVQGAEFGRAGLALLEQTPFALVFTDLHLPDISGEQVSAGAHAQRPGIKVVVVTGEIDYRTPAGVLFDHVLTKPFRVSALRELVSASLGMKPLDGAA